MANERNMEAEFKKAKYDFGVFLNEAEKALKGEQVCCQEIKKTES